MGVSMGKVSCNGVGRIGVVGETWEVGNRLSGICTSISVATSR